MNATLASFLPWAASLTDEQRAEFIRDLGFAAAEYAVFGESSTVEVLSTWQSFAAEQQAKAA